jgi:hypothetical protein
MTNIFEVTESAKVKRGPLLPANAGRRHFGGNNRFSLVNQRCNEVRVRLNQFKVQGIGILANTHIQSRRKTKLDGVYLRLREMFRLRLAKPFLFQSLETFFAMGLAFRQERRFRRQVGNSRSYSVSRPAPMTIREADPPLIAGFGIFRPYLATYQFKI